MRRLQLAIVAIVTSAVLGSVRAVPAQNPRSRYTLPRRPTISPWLDLYRQEATPVGPYHSFVRPRQQLYRALNEQQTAIRRQSEGLDWQARRLGLQGDVLRRQSEALRQGQGRLDLLEGRMFGLRPSRARPTGTGSVFMNYSHYFQSSGISGGSGQRSWRPPAPTRGRGSYGRY